MTTPQINAQRKAELLSTKVEHIDITSFDARPIVRSEERRVGKEC